MRFLADESCDMSVVRALLEQGHDVAQVRDRERGMEDEAVAQLAQREQRVLLREDKDFGQLVHASSGLTAGVMLLRFPRNARSAIGTAVLGAVDALGERLRTAFVVVEPARFRITDLRR